MSVELLLFYERETGLKKEEGRASFVVLMNERRDCRRENKRVEQGFGVLMNEKQD